MRYRKKGAPTKADVVHDEQERRAHEHGGRDEPAVIGAHEHAAQMGDDESHPADHAGDADACSCHEGGGDDDDDAGALGVHAHGGGLVVAHGEDVDAPAQGEQGGAA